MPYDYSENIAQNSFGGITSNGVYQLVSHQPIFQPGQGYPVPICSVPPPQNGMPVFPIPIYPSPHQMRSNPIFNDQHVNSTGMNNFTRKPSPSQGSPPVPAKRHRLNDVASNDIESSLKSDTNSSSSSNEGNNSLEVDSLFYELQCIATEGCSFAENVAKNYRKRPCFKKIELLLSRLRQELNVHHNITSNINSQGTAWAIKDFIFVFSRIVNAWIIMRGYIYDKAEGLDNLRHDFDENFVESFTEWQESTLKMMKTLMGTVENMDVSTQNKSGNKQKKKEVYVDKSLDVKNYDKEFLENFERELFAPKLIENSEEIQVRNHQNRTYFSAGVLKPLKINACSTPSTSMCNSPNTPTTPDLFNWMNCDDINDSRFQFPSTSSGSSGSGGRLYNRQQRKAVSMPATPMDQQNPFDDCGKSRAKKDLSLRFSSMPVYSNDIEAQLEREFGKLEVEIGEIVKNDENLSAEDENLIKLYKDDGHKIIYLLNEVSKLTNADGYTVCINMIVENIKNGKYANLNSILDEFKVLVKQAKSIVENSKEDEKVAVLKKFLGGLEAIINRKAFE